MIKRPDDPIVWYDANRVDGEAMEALRLERPYLSFVPVYGPPDRVVSSISPEPWPTPDELFWWRNPRPAADPPTVQIGIGLAWGAAHGVET
jgi:hypothetical protein